MADIEITPDHLIVHIRGADKFLALKSQLEVPLQHIAGVEAAPPEAHGIYHGLRVGSNLPGVVTAGRFLEHGEWAFWMSTTRIGRSPSGSTTSTTPSW